MRIAVLDLATRQQTANLDQFVDHGFVRIALAALAVQDVFPPKEGQIRTERPVVHHVIGDDFFQHAKVAIKVVFLHPVGWRAMHEPGPFGVGDEIGGAEITDVIPFAIGALGPGQWVLQRNLGQIVLGHIAQSAIHAFFQTGAPQYIRRAIIRQDIAIPDRDPAFLGSPGDLIQPVSDAFAVNHRLVGRHGPRGRGPDHHLRGIQRRIARAHDLELHPNGKALLVVVLNLRLGQRGLFNGRPHNGLRPLIERPVHQEFHEFLGDDPFGVEIHRQIGVFPIAGDPQTFEFFALDIDPAFGKGPAFLTEIDDRHVVLVLALFAVLLFDLPFDRQPVTIPTGDIARVMAHHLVRAHNHVFQDFVQRMTDVQMPVGIGWAVMQHKGRAALLFAQAVIDADLFPLGQPVGLALGQSGSHREIGLGKVQRLFVVGSLGAHFGRSVCQIYGKGDKSARASIRLDPAARLSERRADNSNDDRKASHLGPPYRSSPPQGKAAKHVARSLPVLLGEKT